MFGRTPSDGARPPAVRTSCTGRTPPAPTASTVSTDTFGKDASSPASSETPISGTQLATSNVIPWKPDPLSTPRSLCGQVQEPVADRRSSRLWILRFRPRAWSPTSGFDRLKDCPWRTSRAAQQPSAEKLTAGRTTVGGRARRYQEDHAPGSPSANHSSASRNRRSVPRFRPAGKGGKHHARPCVLSARFPIRRRG